jgi:hypothetical protein
MEYQISGTNSAGTIGLQKETIDEAKAVAQELVQKGFSNVKIKDGNGNEIKGA